MELCYNELAKNWYWSLNKAVISPEFDRHDLALAWHRVILGLFDRPVVSAKTLPKLLTAF